MTYYFTISFTTAFVFILTLAAKFVVQSLRSRNTSVSEVNREMLLIFLHWSCDEKVGWVNIEVCSLSVVSDSLLVLFFCFVFILLSPLYVLT